MLPALPFHVVGVSHHTAGVEVRERLAFAPAEVTALLEVERSAGRTGLLLSTCNRTEYYWTGDHEMEPWFRQLAVARGAELLSGSVDRFQGVAAVRHLFTVAAGLDSQILGESEILGQVRRASELARAAGTMGRDMAAVFDAAINAGRRVRRETRIGRHPASVGSAAVATGIELTGGSARRAVVVGAGEVAEGVLRTLHEQGTRDLVVVNRNPERAAALAGTWDLVTGAWADLPALLVDADLVFVTTAAKRPCIGAALLAQAAAARGGRELVIMDLSLPRNVDAAARALPGLRLLDLDDLQRLCCPVGDGTVSSTAMAQAEQVLAEELSRLDLGLRSRAQAPQLAELHRLGGEIAERETVWALSRLAHLSEREQQIVRDMAQRLVRRVLYPVSRSIRVDEPGDGEESLSA